MTLRISTGLRNKLLDTGSLKSQLDGGQIRIYSGAEPASADNAATGTLLCTVTDDAGAGGLTMAATATGGVLTKLASQIWRGVNAAGGTAGYYRFVRPDDDGSSSTTAVRVQGAVALAGAELNMTSTTLATNASQTIDYYSISLPTL